MGNTENLKELKVKDVERIRERSAISVFKDNLSYGAILERAYIIPKYHLRKQDVYVADLLK